MAKQKERTEDINAEPVEMGRQGDVFYRKVNSTLKFTNMKKVEDPTGLLVMGEGRYHGHYAMTDDPALQTKVEIYHDERKSSEVGTTVLYVKMPGSGSIRHLDSRNKTWTKEHYKHKVEKGIYE